MEHINTEGRSHKLCFNKNVSLNNQRKVTSLCFKLHILFFIMIILMNYLLHWWKGTGQTRTHQFWYFADCASQYIYLNIDQLDVLNKFYNEFISCLYMFRAHVLIVRRSKLYYTVSGIITSIGGRPVHNLCTGRPPIGVMIPEVV